MESYKENLQVLICNKVNADKLIQISLGRNTKFQNETKKMKKSYQHSLIGGIKM